MNYMKRIEITDSGMVIASVMDENGRRVGLKFFTAIFATISRIEKMAKNAHKWADDYIQMCIRQEYNT